MIAMRGHVARRVGELLKLGSNEQRLETAVEEFVRRRGRTALQLAEIYVELERDEMLVGSERPAARRTANAWIKQNGWPTGARFVHGEVSGSYVYDPLGLEPVPYRDWPYARPGFDEICDAVAKITAPA